MQKSMNSKVEKHRVRAVSRIRPFLSAELTSISLNCTELKSCVVPVKSKQNYIGFQQEKYNQIIQQEFKFDAVYNQKIQQEEIFNKEIKPLMNNVLDGKNCTLFCYGPTGSGKTYTAFGNEENPGILLQTIQLALNVKSKKISENQNKNNNYLINLRLSSLEIYNEKVYDLLSDDKKFKAEGLRVLQNNNGDIVIENLAKVELNSINEFYKLYKKATERRRTAFTNLNSTSSRSHAIFTIHIKQSIQHNNKTIITRGKLSVADLAGSENNRQTGNKGDRMTESKNINKSLLALGSVIEALNRKQKPPYRNSILTRILSDCLGGKSISTMICCVSGHLTQSLQTRRCLEFGSNTRKIENKVIRNVQSKDNNKNTNNKNSNNKSNNNNKGSHNSNSNNKNNKNNKIKNRKRKYSDHDDNKSNLKKKLFNHVNNRNLKRRRINYKNKNNKNNLDTNRIYKPSHQPLNNNENENDKQHKAIKNLSLSSPKNLSLLSPKHLSLSSPNNLSLSSPTKKLPIRFSLPPTPSQFVKKATNPSEIQQNKNNAMRRMNKRMSNIMEMNESKTEEKVMVYRNDEFGLPKPYNPDVTNKSLAINYIREGKKYEKSESFTDAIREYKCALKLVPTHNGLKKLIRKLTRRLDKSVTKMLSFDEIEQDKQAHHQIQKRKRLRKKKSNVLNELYDDKNNNNDDDDDDNSNTADDNNPSFNDFKWSVDPERVLDSINIQSEKYMLTMATIGPKKCQEIIKSRPFKNLKQFRRKVKSFKSEKNWKKFIEQNRPIFENYDKNNVT